MTVSLLEDLKRRGWHSSIMTTYSVDPSFYDGTVEMRLRIDGCENNILMADRAMLNRALAATPEAFVNAGRTYCLADVSVPGCFHPKVHLRLGAGKARLIVGSANVTAAGWGSNHEIVTAIGWTRRSTDGDDGVVAPLIAKAYHYLDGWLSRIPGDAVAYKRSFHKRYSPWLDDIAANTEPILLADGSAIDLLCERGDGNAGFLAGLRMLVGDERVRRVVLVSPYWDVDLKGFHALQEAFSFPPTVVALNPLLNAFPVGCLRRDERVRFAALHAQSGPRFLHAKIILVQTNRADHLLFGSPNCSDDALGRPEFPPRNAEVAVYRRFPRGEALRLLELDLSDIVDKSQVVRPEKPDKLGPPPPPPGGTIEYEGEWLIWWPPAGPDPVGASIEIGLDAAAVERVGEAHWRCRWAGPPSFPMVARIRYPNNSLSAPVIVHDRRALRRAARGAVNPRLQRAFNRLSAGEEDIIDLAIDAHLLFALEREDGAARGGGGGGKRPERARTGQDFDDEDAFRAHVDRIAATGKSGRYEMADPGLRDLLDIIIRGARAFVASAAALASAELAALGEGETEDGEEGGGDSEGEEGGGAAPPPLVESAAARIYSPDDLDRRRSQLVRAVESFEAMLEALAENPTLVSLRLCGQTVFIFHLILFGCAKRHEADSGALVRLMALGLPQGLHADRANCFAIRAARIVQAIWGTDRKPGLAALLEPDDAAPEMSDDLFYLIVMSRWAIARSCLALASAPAPLPASLRKVAAHCYRVSTGFGPIDRQAERSFIVEQERKLGFDEDETAALIRQHIELLNGLSAGRPVL